MHRKTKGVNGYARAIQLVIDAQSCGVDKNRQTLLALAVLTLSILINLAISSPLKNASWVVSDFWQRSFPASNPKGVAAIILDQPSLDYLEKSDGLVYPYPREIYGAMLMVSQHLKAKAVGFDILFTESSHHGVEDDAAFAELIQAAEVPTFFPAQDPTGSIKDPITQIKSVAKGLGTVHVPRESDNNLRRNPPFLPGKDNKPVKTLAETLYQEVHGEKSLFREDSLIHFYRINEIPKVSFAEVIRAYRLIEEGKTLPEKFNALREKIWVFGVSAPGLHDFKPTPLGPKTPGVYLHIMGLANRIAKDVIQPVPGAILWSIYLLLVLIPTIIILRIKTPKMAIGLAGSLGFSGAFAVSALLWQFGLWFNPLILLTGQFITAASMFAYRFQSEWKERNQLAKSVENSMSTEMVQLIKEGKVQVSRFGERKKVTILFSDLAGFTSLSEKLPADDLVKVLNTYFDEVVDLIFRNGGYVDKFIGDAVMAVWGAPVAQENSDLDTRQALLTVQQYSSAVSKANEFAKKFYPEAQLEARVGLHTGEVIAGNIGSVKRHNYTVIGDVVNLSARLESLSKQYNCFNLISQDTARAAKDRSHLLEVDTVQVKGKSEPTVIYSFVEFPEQIESYNLALNKYRNADWQEAIDLWQNCPGIPMTQIMVARCESAIKNGTPKQWKDGVWVHDSK